MEEIQTGMYRDNVVFRSWSHNEHLKDNLKTHKLHRKNKRRPSDSFDSDEISDYLSDDDKGFSEEENPAQPVISSDGYYWIGKDYSNTYKEDFKDIADFSRGKSLKYFSTRFIFSNSCFFRSIQPKRDATYALARRSICSDRRECS